MCLLQLISNIFSLIHCVLERGISWNFKGCDILIEPFFLMTVHLQSANMLFGEPFRFLVGMDQYSGVGSSAFRLLLSLFLIFLAFSF